MKRPDPHCFVNIWDYTPQVNLLEGTLGVLCKYLEVPPGNKGPDPALKDTAFKENLTLALKAPDADINSKPDYLPLVAATGMLLLKTNHVTQSYFDSHSACPNESR